MSGVPENISSNSCKQHELQWAHYWICAAVNTQGPRSRPADPLKPSLADLQPRKKQVNFMPMQHVGGHLIECIQQCLALLCHATMHHLRIQVQSVTLFQLVTAL